MNVLKIQTDILKGLIKGGKPIYTTEKDGMVGLCPDKYCVVFCPNKDVYLKLSGTPLDAEKVLNKVNDAEYRLSESSYYFDHILDGKKTKIMRVSSADRSACIQEKYTKYFGKDALYYVSSWNRPVCVYEDDVMVGIIFPVLIRGEEK
jgi:hypothetical protein